MSIDGIMGIGFDRVFLIVLVTLAASVLVAATAEAIRAHLPPSSR